MAAGAPLASIAFFTHFSFFILREFRKINLLARSQAQNRQGIRAFGYANSLISQSPMMDV